MLLPIVLSQIAFFRSLENSRNTMSILLCGALIAAAIAFKQVAAVNWFLLLVLFPIFVKPEKRWAEAIRFAILSLAGAGAIVVAVAFYFWVRHGLSELVENVFTHNLEYIGAMTWAGRLHFCGDTLIRLSPTELVVWILAGTGFVAFVAGPRRRWLAFCAGCVIVG